MSYAKLNIWIRNLDCSLKNVWKAELVVKTCGGDYLVDFNPDVLEKLKKALSATGHTVDKGVREGETTIVIKGPPFKHIEVDVPPGCYIVRAWVCYGNLWSDRVMVIVGCGDEGCVNLIVPKKEHCINEVIIPFGQAAFEMNLDPDKVGIATEVLMKSIGLQRKPLIRELKELTKELRESDSPDASKYAEAFQFTREIVKGIERKK